ncbi:hypothetical protein JKF63_03340 [Porcisia hertigi]|uniref:Uncharacterized protein n=1 Tax=Porcisia hertigi TaxID=2761500 RepID=A0A836HYT2_9TRYP|nr:hypothetical protein JKF63_03340 [Porcisia hertigi]
MDAAVCSSGVHLDKFGLLSTESEAASPASSSSAPLGAPLFFSLTFHFNCPHDGPEFGGSVAALGVAVDFVADVASEKKTVTLLPLTPLSGPQARSGSATANDAFLTAAATDTSPHHSNGLAGPSLGEAADGAPGTVYCLTVRLRNLGALSGIELKHLLQVSVMRVRLAHLGTSEGATAGYSSDSRTEERLLALWNIIWQVRRHPQNEKELIRTVLSPLT